MNTKKPPIGFIRWEAFFSYLQDLMEEVLKSCVFRMGEDILGSALLQQLSVCHEEHPVAHFSRKAHLVGEEISRMIPPIYRKKLNKKEENTERYLINM